MGILTRRQEPVFVAPTPPPAQEGEEEEEQETKQTSLLAFCGTGARGVEPEEEQMMETGAEGRQKKGMQQPKRRRLGRLENRFSSVIQIFCVGTCEAPCRNINTRYRILRTIHFS